MKKLNLSPYWERVVISFFGLGFLLALASIVFLLLGMIPHGVSLVGWTERIGGIGLLLAVVSLFQARDKRNFQREERSNG